MKSNSDSEGLGFTRLLMVLSSLSPLFLLWAVRGIKSIDDVWLWCSCAALVIAPNTILIARLRISKRRNDIKNITIGESEDHREHLLVYLFAMLVPLYDANLGSSRDAAATLMALVFIVFLFWHLNLHYMNIIFALCGYRVFTVRPSAAQEAIGGRSSLVLLTKRSHLESGDQVRAYRISNSVFFEPETI